MLLGCVLCGSLSQPRTFPGRGGVLAGTKDGGASPQSWGGAGPSLAGASALSLDAVSAAWHPRSSAASTSARRSASDSSAARRSASARDLNDLNGRGEGDWSKG